MLRSIDFILLTLMLILVLCKCSDLEFFISRGDDSISKQNIIDELTKMCSPSDMKDDSKNEVCKYLQTLPLVSQKTNGFLKNMMSNIVAGAQKEGKIVGSEAKSVEQKVHNTVDKAIAAVSKIPQSTLIGNSIHNIVNKTKSIGGIKTNNATNSENALHDTAVNMVAASAKLKAHASEGALVGDAKSIENSVGAAAAHIAQSVSNINLNAENTAIKNDIKKVSTHIADEATVVASNVGGALSNNASKATQEQTKANFLAAATAASSNLEHVSHANTGHTLRGLPSF
tara:strand:+ start:30 stop:887 length:858 start_codon:yes stop_codon:yes gene_type:complete